MCKRQREMPAHLELSLWQVRVEGGAWLLVRGAGEPRSFVIVRELHQREVLIPPHAGHASHATCACALSRSLEQTCEAAALLRSFSAAQPL
jgi:hypothetical protein